MKLNDLQQEIQQLQSKLLSETEKYRVAMNEDTELYQVKLLYQRLKTITRQLRLFVIQYEQMINQQMEAYDRVKQSAPK